MTQAKGYAALNEKSKLEPFAFARRALRPNDIAIDILYCGVCHTDLHFARNHYGDTVYPLVPGHEIVGRVTAVGDDVTKFGVGDAVAVGCIVDSCGRCRPCEHGLEPYCEQGLTLTYNNPDRISGENNLGGYADKIVVKEEFVLRVPEGLDLTRAGPLLCAGITTWSPLRYWKVGPGSRVAVAGLGGLGHMGVKLAVGLGAHVTVLTTSPSKAGDARALGAHDVLLSKDESAMAEAAGRFDLVLDTIPVAHDISPYLALAGLDGVVVMVGAIDMLPTFHTGSLVMGRKSLTASMIGGIPETQELLNFCAEKNILPDCEMIAMKDINHAFERMERSDVKYRFVIDMSTL